MIWYDMIWKIHQSKKESIELLRSPMNLGWGNTHGTSKWLEAIARLCSHGSGIWKWGGVRMIFPKKNMGTKTMKQQLTLSFRWDEHDQHQQPVNMYCCCWPIYTKINWSNQGRVAVRRVTYPMLSCLPRSTQICWDWPSFRWSMESVPVQWWWRTGHHPACHCCQSKGRRNCLQIPTRLGRAVKPPRSPKICLDNLPSSDLGEHLWFMIHDLSNFVWFDTLLEVAWPWTIQMILWKSSPLKYSSFGSPIFDFQGRMGFKRRASVPAEVVKAFNYTNFEFVDKKVRGHGSSGCVYWEMLSTTMYHKVQ